jgi:hypothetical protein
MKRYLVILLLLVILVVIIVIGIKSTTPGAIAIPVEIKIITTPTTITDNGPVILKAIRNQSTLETVTMVLANDQDISKVWGIEGACQESLTYLGYFTVTAGVDLQNIAGKDIILEGNGIPSQTAVTLILPPANILHVELDTQRSRVVHSNVSILSQFCGTQLPVMVLEAQSNLRTTAEASARQQGIIKMAQDRASFELQKILLQFGYNKVTVQFNEAYSEQPY